MQGEDKKLAWKQFRQQNCFVAESKWKSHFEISAEVFDALVQWSRDREDDIRTIDFVWEMETGLRMPDETTQQRMEFYWKISDSIEPLEEYFPFDYSSLFDVPKPLLRELLELAKVQESPIVTTTLHQIVERNIPHMLQEGLPILSSIDSLWKFCVGLCPPSPKVATGLLDSFLSVFNTVKSPPKQFGSHLQEQLNFIKDSKIEEATKIKMAEFLRTTSLEALIHPSTNFDYGHFQAYHLIMTASKGKIRSRYIDCLWHLSKLPTCGEHNVAFAKDVGGFFKDLNVKDYALVDAVRNDTEIFERILSLRTQYITEFEKDEELMKMVAVLSWRLGDESKFLLGDMDYGFNESAYVIEPVLTAFLQLNNLKMKVTSVPGKPVVANFMINFLSSTFDVVLF